MFQFRNPFRRSKTEETQWEPWVLRPERKIEWPSWIGSPTAWLALVISTTTAFFSVVYHSDELSLIPALTTISDSIGANVVNLRLPRTVTLVNSGSRPIGVLGVRVIISQPERAGEVVSCTRGKIDYAETSFDQVVVKSLEITVRDLAIRRMSSDEWYSVNPTEANRHNVIFPNLVVCLSVEIVAPDVRYRKVVEIYRHEVSEKDSDIELAVDVEDRAKGHVLIKRNTFWTSVGEDQMLAVLENLQFKYWEMHVHAPKP